MEMEQDSKIVQRGKERKEYRPLPEVAPLVYAIMNGEITLMRDSSVEERRRVSQMHQLNA